MGLGRMVPRAATTMGGVCHRRDDAENRPSDPVLHTEVSWVRSEDSSGCEDVGCRGCTGGCRGCSGGCRGGTGGTEGGGGRSGCRAGGAVAGRGGGRAVGPG